MEERTVSVQEAILHGDCKELQNCLKRGVPLEEREKALKEVCVVGYSGLVPLLLETADIDVNKIYEDGFTLLSIACSQGCSQVVQELLDRGADANLQKKNGWFPLMTASKNGHTDVVKILLKHGAQVNLQKQNGRTALMSACQNGNSEVVRVLLDNNALVDLQMDDGSSALILASENGHSEVVKRLLENGAQLNLEVKCKSSPLSQEEESEHGKVSGLTALMIAKEKGHTEVTELFQQYSTLADQNTTYTTRPKEELCNQTDASINAQDNGYLDIQQLDKEDLSSSDAINDLQTDPFPPTNQPTCLNEEPLVNDESGSKDRNITSVDTSIDNTKETNNNGNGVSPTCLIVAVVIAVLAFAIIILPGPIMHIMSNMKMKSSVEVIKSTANTIELVSTPSIASSRSLSSKPQMMELVHMQSTIQHEGLQILQEIEQDCKKLGYLLGMKERLVSNIYSKSHKPAENCEELVGEWLGGKGTTPITWETFIDALDKLQLRELADKLRQELQSNSHHT